MRQIAALLSTAAAALVVAATSNPYGKKMTYPPTRRGDAADTLHGTPVPDPYRWLEDATQPEVKQWMHAEDAQARAYLSSLPGRDRLASRLRELLYVDAISAPYHFGGRYFYTRRHKDREKAIVYWKQGEHGQERVLIDPNTLSHDGSIALGMWLPSWDGARVVYALHPNNSDEETLHVLEVATGKISDVDVIPRLKYAGPSWSHGGDGFYYTWCEPISDKLPPSEQPGTHELRFHRLGTDPAKDPTLHPRTGDPTRPLAGWASKDGHWLFVEIAHGWGENDVYFRDLRRGDGAWQPLAVGNRAEYRVTEFGDRFYVLTNEGAPRFRVFAVDPSRPARAAWRELIPQAGDAVIESARVVGNHLVLTMMRNAASAVAVHALDGKHVRDVPLPGIGSVTGLVGQDDEDDAYFVFTSFTTPMQIHRTSVARGGASLWAEVRVPIDATPFTVEQVWYPSKDGTRISMVLVHKKGLPRDGSTPFVLYGYGGFNVSMTPSFSGSLFPWLEAGGGYALPNLRGGGEYGEEWHRAGMREHKQNVFDDFAAAAAWLIANRYTRADRLAAWGGSNGGLLVGAALTQHPELFRAVVCAVPLLDMIRYHLFGAGKVWVPEYGSAENATEFQWLWGYSPYHKISRDKNYPAMLMSSADADDRVDPLHARKMVAALQWAQGGAARDGRPVLLRIESNAGHGGGDMIKKTIDSSADIYSFLFAQLGLPPATK
jgi:prolyl oligopeptidase